MDEQYGWICEYLYGSVVFKKKKKKNYSNSVLQDKQRLRPLTDGSV